MRPRSKSVFQAVQDLVRARAIVSCHDVSDGGLDRHPAGDGLCRREGLARRARGQTICMRPLFAEEAGVVVEVAAGEADGAGGADEQRAREILARHGVTGIELGRVQVSTVELSFNHEARPSGTACAACTSPGRRPATSWSASSRTRVRRAGVAFPSGSGRHEAVSPQFRPRRRRATGRDGRFCRWALSVSTTRLASRRQAEGRHPARGGQQRRPGDGRVLPGGRV